jgi:hypothetical protein
VSASSFLGATSFGVLYISLRCFLQRFLESHIHAQLCKMATLHSLVYFLLGFNAASVAAYALDGVHAGFYQRQSQALVPRALPIGTCNPDTPCPNGACCGSNGLCGYSPKECGTGCASNCDAKAECGQYGKPGQQNCPLNVCCSKFGYAYNLLPQIVVMCSHVDRAQLLWVHR